VTDYGFIRISTGSQDAQTQERDILKAYPGALIIRPDTKAASASKGEQVDVLDAVIAKLRKGDRVIVTDSSRLDRRDNLTSQVETMMGIRKTGAVIVSLSPGEETFANGDDLGSWVTTLVKQNANAEKSRTVKNMTYRGVTSIIQNRAHYGTLPAFWAVKGDRYAKQAYCANPDAVRDVYGRVAAGESLANVARSYDRYPQQIKNLVRASVNHTGIVECSYTYEGRTETWTHETETVVDSSVWWAANKILNANLTGDRRNKGGRPAIENWVSGVLACPGCGNSLYLNAGKTAKGTDRTPKLRCSGEKKKRVSCGKFKGINAQPIIEKISQHFDDDTLTPLLAFQRVAGNAHELDELKATLPRLQAQLSVITDRATRRETLAEIETLEDRIDSFEIIPDSFDYAPTGQTVADMWSQGDDTVKRGMARAVKESGLMVLAEVNGQWTVQMMLIVRPDGSDSIIDLGGGICFRWGYWE